MVKTNNLYTRMMAIVISIISIVSIFSTTAFAATSSSGTRTQTITVNTKANWWYPGSESITLKQTKGTRTEKNYNFLTGKTKTKTKKCYGTWKVVAKSTDGKHTLNKKLNGGSLKLSLKANKTYKITVTWDSQADTFGTLDHGSFTQLPTWRVSGTHKVSSYY